MTAPALAYRYGRIWTGVGVGLVALVWYLSLMPNPPGLDVPSSDKIGHVVAYTVLMGWFGQLRRDVRGQVACALGLCIMGVAIEFVQGASGFRSFESADMLADGLGVVLGWRLTRGPFAGALVRVESYFWVVKGGS